MFYISKKPLVLQRQSNFSLQNMRVNLFWKLLIATMHIVKITSTRKIYFFLALDASFECFLIPTMYSLQISKHTSLLFQFSYNNSKKKEKKDYLRNGRFKKPKRFSARLRASYEMSPQYESV